MSTVKVYSVVFVLYLPSTAQELPEYLLRAKEQP